MNTWVALLRGVNVGGKNILPMADLKNDLISLGCKDVQTYIQSGNAVFKIAESKPAPLAKKISARIQSEHGFESSVLLLSADALRVAIDSNPFPDAVEDPKTLHFYFLEKPPVKPNVELLETCRAQTEKYAILDRVFYLHAPDGIGRSRLAAIVERALGVVVTARNFRTVDKLASMISPV